MRLLIPFPCDEPTGRICALPPTRGKKRDWRQAASSTDGTVGFGLGECGCRWCLGAGESGPERSVKRPDMRSGEEREERERGAERTGSG